MGRHVACMAFMHERGKTQKSDVLTYIKLNEIPSLVNNKIKLDQTSRVGSKASVVVVPFKFCSHVLRLIPDRSGHLGVWTTYDRIYVISSDQDRQRVFLCTLKM